MTSPSRPPLPYDYLPQVPSFDLRSDDVADGQMMPDNQVFDGFGMTGGNISPSLSWSGFPAETWLPDIIWPSATSSLRKLNDGTPGMKS